MKDLNTRFLQAGDLLERKGKELQFKKKFTLDEIKSNKHYLIKNKDIIFQINSEYNKVGCHDIGFQRVATFKVTDEMMLSLIKKLILSGKKFNLDLDTYTDEDLDYFKYELEVLSQGLSTKEEYYERIEENKSELLDVLKVITIWDKENNCQFRVYRSGGALYSSYREGTTLKGIDVALILGNLFGLFESVDDLEEIKMVEKDIIEHEYSKLYVLMDYLKENKESLPEDVIGALDIGLEESLTNLGKGYKDSKKYVR